MFVEVLLRKRKIITLSLISRRSYPRNELGAATRQASKEALSLARVDDDDPSRALHLQLRILIFYKAIATSLSYESSFSRNGILFSASRWTPAQVALPGTIALLTPFSNYLPR